MKTSYPITKLKPIPMDEETEEKSEEIEEIRGDRLIGEQVEYLVKFKNYEEPEWIREDHFDTVEIINDYHNQKRIVNQDSIKPIEEPKKSGRPK